MSEKLKIGAVIYAPQVTVIWGIIADFFEKEGFPIEPVYFKDYMRYSIMKLMWRGTLP